MLFLIIILFVSIQSSIELNYTCNPNASCGCSMNSTIVSRIVNGEMAETGAWSWTVSIELEKKYLCGGSIISNSWIITAAHCLEDITPSNVIIHAGSHIRWSENQTRIASQVFIHPDYDSVTYANDIALIKLCSPLHRNNSNIRTICLPSVNSTILTNGEWPVANTTVIAVGWGRLSEDGSISKTLQQVTLHIIDYQEPICNYSIYDYRIQLCASVPNGTKDTCQGDSGGPLMMFSSTNQWILVGLTSYGEGCARPTSSGVYTRVAAYQDWINSIMSNAGHIVTLSTHYILFYHFLLYFFLIIFV